MRVVLLALVVALSGCASIPLPTFDNVRSPYADSRPTRNEAMAYLTQQGFTDIEISGRDDTGVEFSALGRNEIEFFGHVVRNRQGNLAVRMNRMTDNRPPPPPAREPEPDDGTGLLDVRCANCNVLHEYERGNRKDPRPLMKQRAKMELVRA